MKLALFSVVTMSLYLGLFWYTCRGNMNTRHMGAFVSATIVVFAILSAVMYLSLFWCLFIAALILVIGMYIGSRKAFLFRKEINNGVLGGCWLLVPIYVYLATNT